MTHSERPLVFLLNVWFILGKTFRYLELFRLAAGGAAFYPVVDHGKDHDFNWPRDKATDDDDGKRFFDFGAGAGRDYEWNQADAADQAAKEFCPQADARPLDDRFPKFHSAAA